MQIFFDDVVQQESITIPAQKKSTVLQSFLSFLSRTSRPSKRLKELKVQEAISPSAAIVLYEALLYHSPLSSLQLTNMKPGAASYALPGIYHSSHLTSLTLCNPLEEAADAQTVIYNLAFTIAHLPGLAQAHLQLMTTSSAPSAETPPTKLPRLAAPGQPLPPISFDPVIQALSAAPSLTSLTLTCEVNSETRYEFNGAPYTAQTSFPIPCSGITGPFSALQELQVQLRGKSQDPSVCNYMLPTSPLPALTKLQFPSTYWEGAEQALVECLPTQPSLRHAIIKLGRLKADCEAAELMVENFHAVTGLAHLSVEFDTWYMTQPDCMHDVVHGISQLPALTRLELRGRDMYTDNAANWGDVDVREFLMAPLSRVTALRDLRCTFEAWEPHQMPLHPVLAPIAAKVLPSLARLTRLELISERIRQRSEMDLPYHIGMPRELSEGLPPLPELCHLRMGALAFTSEAQVRP